MTTTTQPNLRERGKRDRAARILEATRELIREGPSRSPSVGQIARRAEVSQATVFNLVGPRERIWAALADEAIEEMERRIAAAPEEGPRERARRIATTMADVLRADAAVHRHVMAHWTESGRLLRRNPIPQVVACLRAAREDGMLRADVDLGALGGLIAAACTGALHQWAAGLIDDAAMRRRCGQAVDVAFAAAATDEAREALLAPRRRR